MLKDNHITSIEVTSPTGARVRLIAKVDTSNEYNTAPVETIEVDARAIDALEKASARLESAGALVEKLDAIEGVADNLHQECDSALFDARSAESRIEGLLLEVQDLALASAGGDSNECVNRCRDILQNIDAAHSDIKESKPTVKALFDQALRDI